MAGQRSTAFRSRLFSGQASKKTQLHDAPLLGIQRFELAERAIEGEGLDRVDQGSRLLHCVLQLDVDNAGATFVGKLAPRVVDQDPPHHLRGDREEVPAVVPVDLALSEQLDVRLVHHGGRLHPVVSPFVRQLPGCEHPQLVVDNRHQPVERLAAPFLPFVQNARNLRRRRSVLHLET